MKKALVGFQALLRSFVFLRYTEQWTSSTPFKDRECLTKRFSTPYKTSATTERATVKTLSSPSALPHLKSMLTTTSSFPLIGEPTKLSRCSVASNHLFTLSILVMKHLYSLPLKVLRTSRSNFFNFIMLRS